MRNPDHTPFDHSFPKRKVKKKLNSYILWYVTGIFVALVAIFSIIYAYYPVETDEDSKNKVYPVSEIVNPDQTGMPDAPDHKRQPESPDRANESNRSVPAEEPNQKQSEASTLEPQRTNLPSANTDKPPGTATERKPDTQPEALQPTDPKTNDPKPENRRPAANQPKKEKENPTFWDSLKGIFHITLYLKKLT
ncbi:hypothetical protein SAMN05444955_10789 [Lihuaxuella thermophila]|uniref:Uncharacterized protein n=2 Tax=Lihuaxuella thermophila TaxID=1173111 RepID=A0A1H8ENE6_9BACL|nr:hypothetical protein SAMN05444955_10789 [Lihuaxuella thermophila]